MLMTIAKRSLLISLLLLVLTSGWATVSAAGIRMGNILPTGEVYHANITSMREARYLNIVQQRTDFSCGAAALATLLRYAYGMQVDEQTVLAGMLVKSNPVVVQKQGFSLLDLKNYVQQLGMRARGYRVSEQRLRSLRVPAIVLIDTKGYKHFVVLKRVLGDRVYLADPALGNKIMTLEKFKKAWPSRALFIVIGSGFRRNTVLLQARGGPSARRLLASQMGPITDVELLDFGFSHADLF